MKGIIAILLFCACAWSIVPGETYWPYSFKSSPVGANGKLYLAGENEDVIVLRMGEQFEVLATNTMPDQMFIATPAITGGEIFLRSQNRLYCIHE